MAMGFGVATLAEDRRGDRPEHDVHLYSAPATSLTLVSFRNERSQYCPNRSASAPHSSQRWNGMAAPHIPSTSPSEIGIRIAIGAKPT
jgi:hypothetical protein